MTKKLNTTVGTGDTFIYEGVTYTVGSHKRVNNKMLINLHAKINATSSYTLQVSTRSLNIMLTK